VGIPAVFKTLQQSVNLYFNHQIEPETYIVLPCQVPLTISVSVTLNLISETGCKDSTIFITHNFFNKIFLINFSIDKNNVNRLYFLPSITDVMIEKRTFADQLNRILWLTS